MGLDSVLLKCWCAWWERQYAWRGDSPLKASSSSPQTFFPVPTSLRSGFGFIFVGSVCSLHPPDERSSRSLEFRHFILRFWNHIFTCWGQPERYQNLDCFAYPKNLMNRLLRFVIYLWIFKSKFWSELLPVRFADILLFLKHLFQSFALNIGEYGPPQHPSPWFPSRCKRPWERPRDRYDSRRCYQTTQNRHFLRIGLSKQLSCIPEDLQLFLKRRGFVDYLELM